MRFALVIMVLVLLLAYVGWHLWLLPPLPAWARWLVVALMLAGFGMAFLALAPAMDRLPMGLAAAIYNVGTRSLIVLLYLLLAFLVADLLRLLHLLPAGWLRSNWAACAAVLGVVAAVLIYGRIHYEHKRAVPVALEAPVERPMKLVAVSDLHLGYHNRRPDLARWVDLINAEQPDAVLIAGDIIDRSLRPLLDDGMAAELRRLEAPVYACLGNHEYYAGYFDRPADVERFFADAGITLLRDSAASLGPLAILGRDDRSNPRRLPIDALKNKFLIPNSQFLILLDHQPYHLEEAAAAGIGLQLSGHTHRGQVWPASWITDALYECSWGTLRKGPTTVCVTSGLGIWGPKYRIGTQSEYLVISLSPSASTSTSTPS